MENIYRVVLKDMKGHEFTAHYNGCAAVFHTRQGAVDCKKDLAAQGFKPRVEKCKLVAVKGER